MLTLNPSMRARAPELKELFSSEFPDTPAIRACTDVIPQGVVHRDVARTAFNFVHRQQHLTANIRSRLVHWLLEIGLKFTFSEETVYCAVAICDRFFERGGIPICTHTLEPAVLMRHGCAALDMSAGIHEVTTPHFRDYEYMAASAFTAEQLIEAQRDMLLKLDGNVGGCTSATVLADMVAARQPHESVAASMRYYSDLVLVDTGSSKFDAPTVAEACWQLASRNRPRARVHSSQVQADSGECARYLTTLHLKQVSEWHRKRATGARGLGITKKHEVTLDKLELTLTAGAAAQHHLH